MNSVEARAVDDPRDHARARRPAGGSPPGSRPWVELGRVAGVLGLGGSHGGSGLRPCRLRTICRASARRARRRSRRWSATPECRVCTSAPPELLGSCRPAGRRLHERRPPMKIVPGAADDDRSSSDIAARTAPPAVHDPITTAICGMPAADICAWLKKIRPKWSRSGKTSSCKRQRKHRLESTRNRCREGCSAPRSPARARCFLTVSVEVRAALHRCRVVPRRSRTRGLDDADAGHDHARAGACPSYSPRQRVAFSSGRPRPGRLRRSMRSRASSFPRDR